MSSHGHEPMPLTRRVLDKDRCSNPACTDNHDVLFVHASCHRSADLQVAYDKREGVLYVLCAVCRDRVAAIAVAP